MPEYTRRARRDLEELPPNLQKRALEIASRLDSEPALGKKLKGKLTGLRSASVGKTHRMIYRLGDKGPVVLTIGWRKDVYR
jgi:mRNA-degrading endonuclease RelE of RelBE toxin-antitoxin system